MNIFEFVIVDEILCSVDLRNRKDFPYKYVLQHKYIKEKAPTEKTSCGKFYTCMWDVFKRYPFEVETYGEEGAFLLFEARTILLIEGIKYEFPRDFKVKGWIQVKLESRNLPEKEIMEETPVSLEVYTRFKLIK